MKVWQKKVIASAFVIILILTFYTPETEGSVPLCEVVSYCTGDAANDGTPDLLVISGNGEIDTGERHGKFLLVCDASAEDDMDRLGYIPPEKIQYRIDLSGIKPLKVQLGDVDGDSKNEVAVCVYKTTKFNPVMAKRPFFFDLVEGNLIPVWLGSRLSRPFDDYILYDIDTDEIDELISIELLESGKRVIAIYNWEGFGFEMLTQSQEFDDELRFSSNMDGQTAGTRESGILFLSRNEIRLKFRFIDGKLIYSNECEMRD
jgi:hypothetical protein